MSKATNPASIRVSPNLLLKPQPNSKNLQAHAHIHGKTYRKSMRTWDAELARQRAWVWFNELDKEPKHTQSRSSISWRDLTERYDATLAEGSKRRYHTQTRARHFDAFFSHFHDICEITSGTILDYVITRRKKGRVEPLPQTLNRENTNLRQMFSFAFKHQWIDRQPQVPFIAEALTRRRRRDFTLDEYRTLRMMALKRIREAQRGSGRERISVAPYRQLLYDAIQILANSGLRVDELRSITWRCIDWERGDIVLERAGKRRSNRRLILMLPAIRAIWRLSARRRRWQREHDEAEALPPNELVIALPCGTAVRQLDTGFDNLLKACGFSFKTAIEKHAMTSLRHTYATQAITRKSHKRISVHVLALQMGTSERMIRAHYGHDTVEDYRDELRG